MNSSGQAVTDKQDLDLVSVCRMLWGYKLLIGLAGLACGLAAAAVALTAIPVYRAEVTVVAVQPMGAGSSTSLLAGELGGLESLSGLNLAQAGAGIRAAELTLESRRLAEEFIKRNGLQKVLSRNAKRPPTLWFIVQQFKEGVVKIQKDTHRGATTVAVEWTDPVTAARWANGFVALANELIRTRVLEESSRNIGYLNRQLARTSEIELRQVMYGIIESETKTLMLASGRAEYAFQIVDPAVPPEIRVRPHRALMVLVGASLGTLIGIVAAFVLDGLRRRR
jgi:uncharacterized protein involved in exopolysaccharide biosynthesis